jgi:hypothetical protein
MERSYDVKLKLLTRAATPQNRLILCRLPNPCPNLSSCGGSPGVGWALRNSPARQKQESLDRLARAYAAAHAPQKQKQKQKQQQKQQRPRPSMNDSPDSAPQRNPGTDNGDPLALGS